MSETLLVKGGRVITDVHGAAHLSDIAIADGIITEIKPELNIAGATVVDATDMIVIPGLVDTHKHTWQSAIRHRSTAVDLFTYFGDVFGRIGASYTPEDVYVGTLLGALSALESGTTTLMDWSHVQNSPDHSDAAIKALHDSGIRAVFGHGWPLVDLASWIHGSVRDHSDDVRRIRREILSDDDGLVTLALAGRGPELTTVDVAANDLAMARDLNIRTSIHMGCGPDSRAAAAIAQMNDAGLLGPDLTFVHCAENSDDELKMMADHGVSASVAPQQEQGWPGIGHTSIDRLRGLGITTGLSTSSESYGASDLFTQMRVGLAATRARVNGGLSKFEQPQSSFSVGDVLAMATSEAAAVLGLDHRIGTIGVGKAADLTLVRTGDLNLTPVVEPVAAIVNAVHPGNVDTVIVAGQVRKQHGRLLGVDYDDLRQRALESQHRVLS